MIGALAQLAAVVAEAFAVYVLAELLAGLYPEGSQNAITGITFATLALVSYAHLRLAAWYGLKGAARLAWLAIIPFLALYGVLRIEFAGDLAIWDFGWVGDFIAASGSRDSTGPAFLGTLLLLAVWARAAFRGGDDADLEALPKSLGVPFAAVTALMLVGLASEREADVARASATFYIVGLIALCLSQLALSGATIGGLRAGSVTGVLLTGVFVAVALSVGVLSLVFGLLAPTVGPVLADTIALVLAIVLFPVAWTLEALVSLFPEGQGSFDQLSNFVGDRSESTATAADGESGRIEFVRFAVRGLAVVILLTVVAGVISLMARFRSGGNAKKGELPTAAAGSLGEDLAGWFRALLPGRARRSPGLRRLGVYALYDDVLGESDRRGRPRDHSSTPREFAPVLGEVFEPAVMEEITAAFETAYYGSRPVDDEEVTRLRTRWGQAQSR